MKLNRTVKTTPVKTHEGGTAVRQKPLLELTRAVSTCLLWENTFYESGNDIAKRIAELCEKVTATELQQLAIKARNDLKLRHVPLFLCRQMAKLHRGDSIVSDTITQVVQRPDEMGELLSIYWKDSPRGKTIKIPAQIKKGLAKVFPKFTEYQLSKWDRDTEVKLRDVMFITHPKPLSEEQAELFKKIASRELESADTWEVSLSKGADKRETFERLIREDKLGYMATLMNVRNFEQSNVDRTLVEQYLLKGAVKSKALPFRFVSAAKAAPSYAQALSDAMVKAIDKSKPLSGTTLLVIDISGSMDATISAKSQLTRWEAAAALGVLLREICESCRVFTFSQELKEIANLRGLGLIDAVNKSQEHGGTWLAQSLTKLKRNIPQADRIIVITDEQAHDGNVQSKGWVEHAYLVNVAPYKPGLDISGGWTRINGWSERIVDWMQFEENNE